MPRDINSQLHVQQTSTTMFGFKVQYCTNTDDCGVHVNKLHAS